LDNLLLLTIGLYCNTDFGPLFTRICTGSRDSSVGTVTALLAGSPKNRDLIPGRNKFILSWRMNRQDMGSLSLIFNGCGDLPRR